jgi:hypothetical protein
MEKRDSAIFYRSFYEAINQAPEENQLELYNSIFNYIFNGKEPNLSGVSKMAWMLMKPNIDANIERFKNGKKGGRPRTKKKPNDNQTITKPEPNKDKDVDKDVGLEIDNNNPFGLHESTDDDLFTESFNKFWDAYDWKVDKERCEREWSLLNEEERTQSIKQAKVFRKITVDSGYPVRPLTYLTNKRFNDDLSKLKPKKKPPIKLS